MRLELKLAHFLSIPFLTCFNSFQAIKPFVAFGKETKKDEESSDLGESSMKGLNFYQQYGQHDDRFREILEFSRSLLETQLFDKSTLDQHGAVWPRPRS